MKSIKKGKIILIYLMACLIYCIWLPTYIKTTTPKPTFSEYLATQGVTLEQLKNTMETLNKKSGQYAGIQIIMQQDAQKLLGKDLGNKVEYDNGQLVIKFNGNYITMDEIKQHLMQQTPIKSKDGKRMMLFHNGSSDETRRLL